MIASDLFTLPESMPFERHFKPEDKPWLWVMKVSAALDAFDFLRAEGMHPNIPAGVDLKNKNRVYIHHSVSLPSFATIEGPCWIGPDVEIRPCAYIRGKAIIGPGTVVGNATEVKNSLLLEGVQAPHYNYIGDSVLGNKAHLGAGVICANLRLDQKAIPVHTPEGKAETGMRKLGAIMGDGSEAGCNAVLQPGTILGKNAAVMPTLAFGGYLEPDTLAFHRPVIGRVPRDAYPKSTPRSAG